MMVRKLLKAAIYIKVIVVTTLVTMQEPMADEVMDEFVTSEIMEEETLAEDTEPFEEETNEELTSKIQVSQIVSEKTNEYDIELTKKTTDNQEDLNLVVNITIDENVYTISLVNEMNSEEDSIKLNTSINYKKDILTVSSLFSPKLFFNDSISFFIIAGILSFIVFIILILLSSLRSFNVILLFSKVCFFSKSFFKLISFSIIPSTVNISFL